ncbi:glycoside hydrolase family 2 protein [Streptomyces sp. NPDC048751]|uniref:glycoside hydrolase family 2 protein n=1 Tax=Streptomyces sp. NPDC048751 TaxID=3365591 RepID=UPI0037217EAC
MTELPARQDPRVRIDLNTDWRFVRTDVAGAQAPEFDDHGWAVVSTPHTWNADDGANGGYDYYRGIGWYRRRVEVPADLAGRTLMLQFAGANQVAEVWVNGTRLGLHRGGYSRFRFDATAALSPGQDNVLAVKVSNAIDPDIAPLDADYTFSGGIYRDVSLWAVDRLHVQLLDRAGPGVYLRQSDVTSASARVTVTTKLWNDGDDARSVAVRTVVTDGNGAAVSDETSPAEVIGAGAGSEIIQTIDLAGPRLWNGTADPHLYRATVEVHDMTSGTGAVRDVVTETFGLRSVAVEAATGFHLNGTGLSLKGVNLHQDRAVKGWAVDHRDHLCDFDLIREIGATAVRMAHYQHDQKVYELADERGLVVWAEIPLINHVCDSAAFTVSTEDQLRELIRQNFNHPSIVFWGIGNECDDDSTANSLLARLAAVVEAEDPDRISTYASNSADNAAVGLHTQTCGFNKYYGWYEDADDGVLGAWADAFHENHPDRKIAVSEYGAGANIEQHASSSAAPVWDGPFHPEEYQALLHEAAWQQLEARPYIWGTFVWSMFDFASDRRDEGSQPGINDKGLITRDRAVRKDAFYWYKANWASSPTLHITSRRWRHRTEAVAELKVYSNASQVAATVNGTFLGTRSSADHIFKWPDVVLKPGDNTVIVTAAIGDTVHTDTVTWTLETGPPE